jgi:hypothetical protein
MEKSGIKSCWHRYPSKNKADRRTVVEREHHAIKKTRWGKLLRDFVDVDVSLSDHEPRMSPQKEMFS